MLNRLGNKAVHLLITKIVRSATMKTIGKKNNIVVHESLVDSMVSTLTKSILEKNVHLLITVRNVSGKPNYKRIIVSE